MKKLIGFAAYCDSRSRPACVLLHAISRLFNFTKHEKSENVNKQATKN